MKLTFKKIKLYIPLSLLSYELKLYPTSVFVCKKLKNEFLCPFETNLCMDDVC